MGSARWLWWRWRVLHSEVGLGTFNVLVRSRRWWIFVVRSSPRLREMQTVIRPPQVVYLSWWSVVLRPFHLLVVAWKGKTVCHEQQNALKTAAAEQWQPLERASRRGAEVGGGVRWHETQMVGGRC